MQKWKKYKKSGESFTYQEKGMIVVETVLSFTVFVILVFSIIYFINMLILHNKIQFAINSAAHELASYTYLYAAFGVRDAEEAIKNDGKEETGKIDDAAASAYDSYEKIIEAAGSVENAANKTTEFLAEMQNFGNGVSGAGENGIDMSALGEQFDNIQNQASEAGGAIGEAGKDVADAANQVKDTANQIKGLLKDKNGLIKGLAYIVLEGAEYTIKDLFGTGAAYLLTSGYLKQGNMDADAFLKAYGVKDGYAGLDFTGSTIFCDEDFRMIDIVVEYDVDMSFARLIFPAAQVHMVNRITIPAWLNGDGAKVVLKK